jgi:hypothetical protein
VAATGIKHHLVAKMFHLAQVNVARLAAPLDSPALAPFVANLERVNALADKSAGFVWRLQTEDGDATAIRAFDDADVLVNMSVWESVEALGEFVYRSPHVEIMRRRAEFFVTADESYVALWWVPAGTTPTVADAIERLDAVRRHGPTPFAFNFRRLFPPPDSGITEPRTGDHWTCPA